MPHGPSGTTASFRVATGTATLFVIVASTLGLLLDQAPVTFAAWTLRGPIDPEMPAARRQAPSRADRSSGGRAALQRRPVPV